MHPLRTFVLLAAACLAVAHPSAQSTRFQFYVSATDARGAPVTDLRVEDVSMSENAVPQQVTRIEPAAIPLKLTIAVDNGLESEDALGHYRSGLTGLVGALPRDVEVTLITIAPQPYTVVKPTTDRLQILKGITGFAPEQARPRFTDALVEYSRHLEREARIGNARPYVPVLLMLSTAANESHSYQVNEIEKAVSVLVGRKARLNVVIISTRTGLASSTDTLNSNLQAIIAIPAVKATNGRYEALALSSRLVTLLPEWGKDLSALHTRQTNQYRVTVERRASGPLQNPRVELGRAGVVGTVSTDGYLP